MEIESTQIITNFDKKIQYINLEMIEEVDEEYNATSYIFHEKNFTAYIDFGYSKYDQTMLGNATTKLTIRNNENKFTELQLYGSNGFNYVFYTNTIEYIGKRYYLLDIQNLKIENETTGDRFDFLDMSRGFTSDIIYTAEYTNYGNALNQNDYNDRYITDEMTVNNLSIATRSTFYKNTKTFKTISNNNNNFLVKDYNSSLPDTTNLRNTYKKINNIYSLNDTNFNYQYNNEIYQYKGYVYTEHIYEQNTIINNDKTKTSNYANSGLRNIMTQSESIDLNYNDYINFEGHLSTELVLLPVEVSPEQNLNLNIFTSLENIPITATMTLGAVFSVPIVILFFLMIKRIAGV